MLEERLLLEQLRQELLPVLAGQRSILERLSGLSDGQLAVAGALRALGHDASSALAATPAAPAPGAAALGAPPGADGGPLRGPAGEHGAPAPRPVAVAGPPVPVVTLHVPDDGALDGGPLGRAVSKGSAGSQAPRWQAGAPPRAGAPAARAPPDGTADAPKHLGAPPPLLSPDDLARMPSHLGVGAPAVAALSARRLAPPSPASGAGTATPAGSKLRLVPPSPCASAAAQSSRSQQGSCASSSGFTSSPHAVPNRLSKLMRRQSSDRLSQLRTAGDSAYRDSGLASQLVRSPRFERLSLVAVSLNAAWIAVETDLNGQQHLLDSAWPFVAAENAFCLFFAAEWLIRLAAFRSALHALRDSWMVFDTVLVAFMVLEAWVLPTVLLAAGDPGPSVLGALRWLRLARLVRICRLLRSLPEVLFMVRGVAAATHSVGCTFGMLFATVYVFGIAFTQMGDGTAFGPKYFASIPESMYTLLLDGAFMCSGREVLDAIRRESALCFAVFVVFVLVTHLTILNLLIGVLCEVVSEVSSAEKEKSERAFVREKVRQVLEAAGREAADEREMQISRGEFLELLQNEEAMELLERAGVDMLVLLDFADFFFQSDRLGHQFDKSLGFDDFIGTVLKLRSGGGVGLRDVLELRKFVRDETLGLQVALSRIEARLGHAGPSA